MTGEQFLDASPRRIWHGMDATAVLTVYLCLLLAIPSPMVVASLGSAGAPSAIMALGALFWWLWFNIHRDRPAARDFQPVRAAMLFWLTTVLISYGYTMSAPIPYDEISPADSGLLKIIGMAGILFVANDGISDMDRFRVMLRRLAVGASLIAVFGLVQYVTKQLYVDLIKIPGLTAGTADWSLGQRGGFVRVSGTSTSPIEYGVVMTILLPLVVTFGLKAPRRRWIYLLFTCALTLAVLLSISRSTLLCAAVGIFVLGFAWAPALRVRALIFIGLAVSAVFVTVPGVLGTLTNLFTGAAEDPSIASRTGSYDVAWSFFEASPLVGRGFGTFLPKYWILDNGYLGQLIEGGVVGLIGLVSLIVTAGVVARRAHNRFESDFDRNLAQALAACVASGAAGLAFFDTFAFPQSAGTFFLVIGLSGACWRLAKAEVRSRRRRDTNRADSPGGSRERLPGSLGLHLSQVQPSHDPA